MFTAALFVIEKNENNQMSMYSKMNNFVKLSKKPHIWAIYSSDYMWLKFIDSH